MVTRCLVPRVITQSHSSPSPPSLSGLLPLLSHYRIFCPPSRDVLFHSSPFRNHIDGAVDHRRGHHEMLPPPPTTTTMHDC
ncbi:hypothetical protein MUK42_25479 [Musa troglodytarum]|uniref:Uncharacterized protein n=1 Tax=Musa troglodytarum TaxID=320322 RepID=A0A9E7I5L2_9LILI|nr:hypothetical protein MUK42_25479 [Musa troglodytarum]